MDKKSSGGATHGTMGTKSGATSGLEDGLASVQKFTAGQAVDVNEKTQRPAKNGHEGKIATK